MYLFLFSDLKGPVHQNYMFCRLMVSSHAGSFIIYTPTFKDFVSNISEVNQI